ncbi:MULTISPECIES: hypothetical protein [Hyphobacterium]|uniref:Uncharacterized protein n=1 Tax=Hyphobacterium vulgare TaxID=1736751 RepID=A0ABV6ZUA2_9PROT
MNRRLPLPEPGRDGNPLELAARARVNQNPKEPDQWAPFDVSHPIEKMRLRGSLGADALQIDLRYRAARVWFVFWNRAFGYGHDTTLRESVDGGGDGTGSANARAQAVIDRTKILGQPGMTRRRFYDLDAICGGGSRISELAQATHRDQKTVRESLLTGLDVVAGFQPWDRYIQGIPTLSVQFVAKAS